METVFTKRRSKGLELKLGGFEEACKLKNYNKTVSTQGLSSAMKLAKKVDDTVSLQLTDDVYDVGMIAFHLLDGVATSSKDYLASVANFSVAMTEQSFVNPQWRHVSDSCKELLTFMLHDDQRMRFNIEQVMRHPWVTIDN